nr:XRE family transcriptional regulator [Nitrospirillum amazonense]
MGTPGFVPGRLREAREAQRIPSMSALARRLGVNASTVSRWEDGTSSPDPEALNQLATELRVRPEFFLRPQVSGDRPVFFRSLSSTYVRDLAFQRAQMTRLQEIAAVIQHYVDLPPVDIPDMMRGSSYKQLREEDIERIALDLRQHWKLGIGPCVDMVSLMERVGFVVGSIEMGTVKLDGLCGWPASEDRPHVLLATDKMAFVRRQMDAAHEMAHAILHRDVTEEDLRVDLKTIEAQAFRLGSAFLMPSSSYPLEVRVPSLATFLSLKSRWRVSIKAQIKRMSDLGFIEEGYAPHLYKLYSAKGWSREEPLDRGHWPLQQPTLLAEAMNLIVDSGIRRKADLLALEFTLPAGEIETLSNLPAGWFNRERAEIVQLNSQFSEGKLSEKTQCGDVIPFRRA